MTIAQRVGQVSANLETATRAQEFCLLARAIALSKRGLTAAQMKQLSPKVKRILEDGQVYGITPIEKAAAAAGSTSDSTWAGPLAEYDTLANAFVESLRNIGAFDRLLPAMKNVPMRTRVGMVTVGMTANIVPFASAKPITKFTVSATTMAELKAVAIAVVTAELLKFGGAGDLFNVDLANAVAVTTDSQFISILKSGAPSNGASGVTAEHVRNDLRAALSNVTIGQRSRLFWITTSAIAKTLAVMHTSTGDAAFPGMTYRGGDIGGIEVVVSDGVSAGEAILVDASQIAAVSETVTLSYADEASVQMEETSPDSPPTSNTVLQSFWQTNWRGIKAERFFSAAKLSTTGVAVTTNIAWVGDSPGGA